MKKFVQVVFPYFNHKVKGVYLREENGRTYIKTWNGLEVHYPSHLVEEDTERNKVQQWRERG